MSCVDVDVVVVAVVAVVVGCAVVAVAGRDRRVVHGVAEYGDVLGLSDVGTVERAVSDVVVVGGIQRCIFVEPDPDQSRGRSGLVKVASEEGCCSFLLTLTGGGPWLFSQRASLYVVFLSDVYVWLLYEERVRVE